MKTIADTVAAAKERTATEREEALRNIDGVKNQGELNNWHANYWMSSRKAAKTATPGGATAPAATAPATPTKSKYTVTVG